MNTLKVIGNTLIQLVKQAWGLPQTIANAVEHRRLRTAAAMLETERLDRIRNPSKYRGK
jgi:hypothetical protein